MYAGVFENCCLRCDDTTCNLAWPVVADAAEKLIVFLVYYVNGDTVKTRFLTVGREVMLYFLWSKEWFARASIVLDQRSEVRL